MHLHMTYPELAIKLCSRCVWDAHELLISAKGIASLRSDTLGRQVVQSNVKFWVRSVHLCNSLHNNRHLLTVMHLCVDLDLAMS